MQLKCRVDAYSCSGSKRADNQDAIAHDEARGLSVLADGMGGHNAGDVASRLVVESLLGQIQDYLRSHPSDPTLDEAREQLKYLIAEVNQALFQQASSAPELEGMGCTLVVVWLVRTQVLIANIGDSRCYHLRQQVLKQVTRDHSFVQFQLDHGLISEAEVQQGQFKNYLLRSVGTSKKVSTDFFVLDLEPGDVLLAVSDGMTETLDHEAVQRAVIQVMDGPRPALGLVTAALHSGSCDNISVQFIRVE